MLLANLNCAIARSNHALSLYDHFLRTETEKDRQDRQRQTRQRKTDKDRQRRDRDMHSWTITLHSWPSTSILMITTSSWEVYCRTSSNRTDSILSARSTLNIVYEYKHHPSLSLPLSLSSLSLSLLSLSLFFIVFFDNDTRKLKKFT